KFINYSLNKIQEVGDIIGDKKIYIEVDGGINANNVEHVVSCGCNVVVAGSFIFSGNEYKKQIEKLRVR
ncbi:MAG: ribulose-phosphate 3-epimerase, partial [Deferribacterota bacterium]|nr:ribulose-phosphate 3-epimerase [Deferribacterota bacterium]